MRLRFLVTLGLAISACEDGPYQPFTPLPAGVDPNRGSGSSTDPARQAFAPRPTPPTGPMCTQAQRDAVNRLVWDQDIIAGIGTATIDMSGGPSWTGLTIAQLLASPPFACGADIVPDGSFVMLGPLTVYFDPTTHKASFMTLDQGYVGSLHAKSRFVGRFGDHTYEIPVGRPILRDMSLYAIDWAAPQGPNDWRNELYDAVAGTFATTPPYADCNVSGACIVGTFGDVAYYYLPTVGFGFWVPSRTAGQSAASTPNRVDVTLERVLAYASTPPLMKLDAEGPTAATSALGVSNVPCTVRLGMTFGDFTSACVEVTGDAAKDQRERAKLLGGHSHDAERFRFDLTGFVPGFTAGNLAPNDVLHDASDPSNGDALTALSIGQPAIGGLANDHANDDPSRPIDLHGSGLVNLEYARLVQAELNRATGGARTLGDAACNAAGATDVQLRAAGCTGFEGFVTSAPAALVGDAATRRLALGMGAARLGIGGMTPGHHTAVFCNDATGSPGDYALCDKGDTFVASLARVVKILGHGSAAKLPREARDLRFYFGLWFKAFVKYLRVAGDVTSTSDVVHAQVARDADFVLVPPSTPNGADSATYVDRSTVAPGVAPTRVTVTVDLTNGILLGYDFARGLLRGEAALYASMTDHRAGDDPPGKQDTVRLSNVFGSQALASAWSNHPPFSAYHCATSVDAASCAGQTAPADAHGAMLLDEDGRPLLAAYEGAFANSPTQWRLGSDPDGSTLVRAVQTYGSIQSTLVRSRLFHDPYDLASLPLPNDPLDALLPSRDKSQGGGFSIAVTGTRDKTIQASVLALGGTTLSADVYWDWSAHTRARDATAPINLLAVASSDFYGDVFLCRDAASGDLLRTRMYAPVEDVLDWLTAHPAAYQTCQMSIRYTSYGTAVDSVTSIANGVRVSFASGTGRVGSVLLFAVGQ